MAAISRVEYESQLAQLTELKFQNQWLLEQLGLAKNRQFGVSSERLQKELMGQLSFMAHEAEVYAYRTKNATVEQVAVKTHAYKRQRGNVLDVVPERTSTEVMEHCFPGEKCLDGAWGIVMEEIGKEVRRNLKMEPSSGFRRMYTKTTPANSVKRKQAKAIFRKHPDSRYFAQAASSLRRRWPTS